MYISFSRSPSLPSIVNRIIGFRPKGRIGQDLRRRAGIRLDGRNVPPGGVPCHEQA
ncbi:conserved hypothetical protein [Burkholderia pseudomallei Pakistan 9]|nr:conserved hypothetical protein [Burkholderia pseudomallei Pakistan 9]